VAKADHNVFHYGQSEERPHQLKSPSDAALAELVGRQTVSSFTEEMYFAGIRFQCATNKVKQGRLSGSIWTHDSEDLAFIDGETYVSNRGDAAKAFGNRVECKEGHEMFNLPREAREENAFRIRILLPQRREGAKFKNFGRRNSEN
jgi:hypothetical protein